MPKLAVSSHFTKTPIAWSNDILVQHISFYLEEKIQKEEEKIWTEWKSSQYQIVAADYS